MTRLKHSKRLIGLFTALFLHGSAMGAMAMDDDVPFFAGRTGSPNVMFILDTSNSMQDSPYFKDDGYNYYPSGQTWKKGVKINPDCNGDGTKDDPCILDNTPGVPGGSVQYDDYKYVTVSSYLTLPGRIAPTLPGQSVSTSLVTTIRDTSNACSPSMECDNRIYDSSVTWSSPTLTATIMSNTYKYWKVAIRDTTVPSVQYRNLDNYSASGYWTVYGGNIEYNPLHTYEYELITSSPGEVSYTSSSTSRIYDKNFDWTTLTPAIWTSTYNGHVVEIISGTNQGERRTLSGYNTTDGYWTVSSGFPVVNDYTSTYKIITDVVPEDNMTASGGNHPDSKMYQAKLALQRFLDSGNIKTCDGTIDPASGVCSEPERYLLNLGFATYLQARTPITRAKYYRKIAGTTIHHDEVYHPEVYHPAYHQDAIYHPEIYHPAVYHPAVHHDAILIYQYRYKNSHEQTFQIPNGCSGGVPVQPATFTTAFSDGNTTQTLSIGDEFNRSYAAGQCYAQTIRYRVTNMVCSPIDSLPNRMNITVRSDKAWTSTPQGVDPDGSPQWGYTSYGTKTYTDPSATCATYTPLATVDSGTGILVTFGQDCYQCNYTAPYDDAAYTDPEWTEPAWTEPAVDIAAWTEPAWTEPAYDEIISYPYYATTIKEITGDIRKKSSTTPGYINSNEQNPFPGVNYVVTPYKGECSGSWQNCTSPDPENTSGDGKGDYTLLTSTMADVPINSSGGTGTLTPLTYDISSFKIPSQSGDTNHPHGWSYKRTAKAVGETYKYDDNTALDDHYIYAWDHRARWGEDVQKSPYFPSEMGSSRFSNFNGDDQVLFVDLPVYNEGAEDKGDDLLGTNITTVKSAIGLNRAIHPEYPTTVYTMAPISKGSLPVSSTETVTGQGTPIAASLEDARKYYQAYLAQDSFSQGGCRQNFIVLLTDGLESCSSDPAAPVAAAAALQNLVTNNIATPVKVYVIGFGLDKSSQSTLNSIADAGGTGHAYFANNVEDTYDGDGNLVPGLVTILAHDIVDDILSGSYGRAQAAVSQTNSALNDLKLYYTYFDYPTWRGHLEAWNLDPETGEITTRVAHWASESVTGKSDAGYIISEDFPDGGLSPSGPSTRRQLYTSLESGGVFTRIDFTPANVNDLKSLINPDGSDINGNTIGDAVTPEDQDAIDIINYVHHPGYNNSAYLGNRDSSWPLADIYNSSPVVVPPPSNEDCQDLDGDGIETWPLLDGVGYCQFKEFHKNRDTVIYVGANGGMIEAIAAGAPALTDPVTAAVPGGYEKWGYIPHNALGKVRELKEGHRFSMDLPIAAAEVDTSVGLLGTGWKTMLIAGQRKGGNSYTALDVTNPDSPQPMWEFSHPHLGQTWSEPSFARLRINGTGTSVVIFGGGYSMDADVGNRVFIVRASDGTLVKELTVGSATNNVPGRLRMMRYITNKTGTVVDYRTNLAKLPDGTAVNYSNRKYNIEAAYFGDTSGTIWRLSGLNNDAAPDNAADPFGPPWSDTVSLTPLYVPDADKQAPIYYRPIVYDIKKGSIDTGVQSGCVMRYVLAGTGDEQSPTMTRDGANVPISNYFIEIEDRDWIEDEDGPGTSQWTVAQQSTGKFRLNWRLNLGRQLPYEKYGFFLAPDGSRVQIDGKDVLNSVTYILDWSDYTTNSYSINSNGNLINADNKVVALEGNFLIRHNTGSPMNDSGLYKDPAGSTLIAINDSYILRDISLWLTDENGCYLDTDGSCLVDADNYQFDNDGWLMSGGSKILKNGEYVSGIADLGEKVLSEPVTVGGDIFFTGYTPEGGCKMGKSYLYGLSISTCSKLGGEGVLEYDIYGNENTTTLRRNAMGFGITSAPVLATSASGITRAYIMIFDGGAGEGGEGGEEDGEGSGSGSGSDDGSDDGSGGTKTDSTVSKNKPQLKYWRQN